VKNYFFNPRYWVKGLKNPEVAWNNSVAILKHPLLYRNVCMKAEGLIDHYLGTLLYTNVLTCKAVSQNIVEVGAFKGLSTIYLSRAAFKAGRRVKSFELFSGLPTSHPDLDPGFHAGQYASSVNEFEYNVKVYGKLNVVDLIIGDARQNMLPAIGDGGFSLAFLDVDVWEVMRELLLQLLSVAKGGEVIIVHDIDSPGVRKSLNEFVSRSRNMVMEQRLNANTIAKLQFPRHFR